MSFVSTSVTILTTSTGAGMYGFSMMLSDVL
jgi:hypothetical protein